MFFVSLAVPHLADPQGHDVRAGGAVVQVEHHHAQDDGEGDQDHGEHDVVDDHGDAQGRLRDPVGQQEHEDSQGDEDGDGQGHLLPCGDRVTTSKLFI